MIYVLYGEDEFSIDEHLSSMMESVGTPDVRDVNTSAFDGARLELNELAATCDTVPFLAPKRLVVVRGLLSLSERRPPSRARGSEKTPAPAGWEGLPQYVAGVPESTELVFVDGRLAGSNPLLAAIRPHATIRTFPLPRPGELTQWIRSRAVAEGIEIEPEAIASLAEAIGPDLRVIVSELRKLALYRWGETIQKQDVQRTVSYTRKASVFPAVDAMIEGRPGEALRLTRRLMQSGDSPGYVLAMMARQVRLLLLARDLASQGVPAAEKAKRLGLVGYPLRKTLEQERLFADGRLAKIHRTLLEADLTLKTRGLDEGLVLDLLVAELASGGPA